MLMLFPSLLLALSMALIPWQPQVATGPTLVVGSGIGQPGGVASVLVRLNTAGIPARSYQVNLSYDGAVFPVGQAVRFGGTPDPWTFSQHSPVPGDLRALAFSFNPADFQPLPRCINGWCGPVYKAVLDISPETQACRFYPVVVASQDVRAANNQLIQLAVTNGAVWVTNGNC